MWLGSEIGISVTSVSLPSLLFLIQRAIRDGAWSLISTRGGGSRSRLVNPTGSRSHPYTRDDNSTELDKPSFEFSTVTMPGEPSSNSYVTAVEGARQTEPGADGFEHPQATGIYVRNDIVVS